MDLTGAREAEEREQAEPEADTAEAMVDFTDEQAARLNAVEEGMVEVLEGMSRLNHGGHGVEFGLDPELERKALLNAVVYALDKLGLVPQTEMLVLKHEAMLEMAQQAHANAKDYAREQTAARITATPADVAASAALHRQPGAPPLPPRKQRRRR